MAEAKEKWDEVGERFSELGRALKDRFDANAAFGADEREKVNDALRQLGDALDAGFTTIGDTLRDPAIRDEMKNAGSSIADAIAATLPRRLRRDQASLTRRARRRGRRSAVGRDRSDQAPQGSLLPLHGHEGLGRVRRRCSPPTR